jgi:hypothetical protein
LALASEGEENQGIVCGKIDETIAGELFQHALTSSVVALLNAKGEGAKDSLGGLQGLAVDGEDLAEFDEVVRLGAAKGAETELGADLADTKSGACGSLGFATGAGAKAGRRHERALFEAFLGQNASGILLEDLGFFGDSGRNSRGARLGQEGDWRAKMRRETTARRLTRFIIQTQNELLSRV